jgi:glyoxylate/hydroxypyruvate reductase A
LAAPLFAKLPPGAYVVNASRGSILVESDLIAALEAGRLAGAALDVHVREPLPPESPIWSHDKIIVTPHIAAMPRPEVTATQLLENLQRARRGEPLNHLVDRERGY